MENFDPTTSLSPDDPLQKWLADPAMVDFVKQKALEHAKSLLGFAGDASIDATNSYKPPGDVRLGPAETRPFRLDPVATESWRKETPIPATSTPPVEPKPSMIETSPLDPLTILEEAVPLPKARPVEAGPGATDISASSKKKPSVADATGDFAKSLSALRPIQPPPVNPVGTPSVHATGQIAAPNIQNLLALFGAQSKPDPVSTLGRLLVAGKA